MVSIIKQAPAIQSTLRVLSIRESNIEPSAISHLLKFKNLERIDFLDSFSEEWFDPDADLKEKGLP